MPHPSAVQQPDEDRHNDRRRRHLTVQGVLVLADSWQRFPAGLAEELTGLPLAVLVDRLHESARSGSSR